MYSTSFKPPRPFLPNKPTHPPTHPPLQDIILLMSVNPGFGGQSFIPETLKKLKEARKMIDESGYDIRLEVDGG